MNMSCRNWNRLYWSLYEWVSWLDYNALHKRVYDEDAISSVWPDEEKKRRKG